MEYGKQAHYQRSGEPACKESKVGMLPGAVDKKQSNPGKRQYGKDDAKGNWQSFKEDTEHARLPDQRNTSSKTAVYET
ncbi:hypothetical protein ACFORG_16375 [Lutimaribacter marinistellae]|uniref:Uncharacterized protein n=1 Tax=Lutimaribacter marinistellae TaxID=1820329 RepID=A0ABV7TK82_9RHOB